MQQNFIVRLGKLRHFKFLIISLFLFNLFYLSGCSTKQNQTATDTGASIGVDNKKAAYYYKLGLANLETGNMSQAIFYLKKAYEIDPNNYQVLNALGIAYARVGEYAKAEQLLKKAISLHPNKGEAYTNLGVLYASLKKYNESIKYLQKAVSLDGYKNKDKALFNLALIYLKLGNHEKYEEYIKKSIAYNPYNALAYVSLGNYYLKNGQYLNAYDVFLSALSNGLETPEILVGLGKTHYYLKNYDKAKYYLNKASKMVKNNPLLKQEIETYLAKIKRKEMIRERTDFADRTDVINEDYFVQPPEKETPRDSYQVDNRGDGEEIDLAKYQPPSQPIQTTKKKRTYTKKTSYTPKKTTSKKSTSTTTKTKKPVIRYGYPEKKTLPKTIYKYYLQIGVFSNYNNALRTKKRVEALGVDAKIVKVKIGNDTYYRVIVGYFKSNTEARRKKIELAQKNPFFKRAIIKYTKEGN